jgi:hypothetical protein
MQKELQQIQEASEGLLFMSETDHPFEIVAFRSSEVEKEMRQLSGKGNDAVIEKQTVDYFFRNMVRVYPSYPDDQRSVAQRFLKLQELLKQKLKDVQVYRIGSIQVDVFIIGQLKDGGYGGLRTKVVET